MCVCVCVWHVNFRARRIKGRIRFHPHPARGERADSSDQRLSPLEMPPHTRKTVKFRPMHVKCGIRRTDVERSSGPPAEGLQTRVIQRHHDHHGPLLLLLLLIAEPVDAAIGPLGLRSTSAVRTLPVYCFCAQWMAAAAADLFAAVCVMQYEVAARAPSLLACDTSGNLDDIRGGTSCC